MTTMNTMTTKRLPVSRPSGARRARRGPRWLAVLALLLAAFVAGGALAYWRQNAITRLASDLASALGSLPPLQLNPTDLLYTRQPGAAVDPTLLLLAPLVVASVASLLSLGGPPWRRVTLALLGLFVAAFNLLTCLAYVWEFAWEEASAGVIGAGAYIALSASAGLAVLTFGCWHLALARAWRWPMLRDERARGVRRIWVALAGCGAAALLASNMLPWGRWRAAVPGASHSAAITPLLALAGESRASQTYTSGAALALPLCALLCVYLLSRAPRAVRPPLALLGLLSALASLALGLLTLARLYLHASGSSVLEGGAAVGLGGGALLLIALFGLLSTPPPTTSIPAAAPATIPIAAATTRRVTAPVSAPVALRRAPATRRLAETKPVGAP